MRARGEVGTRANFPHEEKAVKKGKSASASALEGAEAHRDDVVVDPIVEKRGAQTGCGDGFDRRSSAKEEKRCMRNCKGKHVSNS